MSKSISKGGRMIMIARVDFGYTRVELAERTGIALNTIANWETGKTTPPYDFVEMIVLDLNGSMESIRERIKNAA